MTTYLDTSAGAKLRVEEDESTALAGYLDGISDGQDLVSLLHEAGLLPGTHLRSLDALHLDKALRVNASTLVAYDARLLDAARSLGLRVRSPA